MIYLDNNASTPMDPKVMEIYRETLSQLGNGSSIHQAGRAARRLLNESRESLAEILQVHESSLVFTSGGTEAIHLAMLGAFLPLGSKRHLVVSQVEHSAVLETARFLERHGVEVTEVGVDGQGRIDPDEVAAALRPETRMIAVMFANNETGNIFPVKRIGEIARERRILYFCDSVQVVGKLPLDLNRLPIDILSASAHKFHGPKGVGFLYINSEIELEPVIHGGRQERGRRAGTENIPGIVAMAEAFRICDQEMAPNEREILELRRLMETEILAAIPETIIHGDPQHRLGNTLNLRFPGISGEAALMNLDMAGIAVSIGAACDSGSIEPSHVLRAMGLNPREAMDGLRFSLSRFNTREEVEVTVKTLTDVVQKIRAAA